MPGLDEKSPLPAPAAAPEAAAALAVEDELWRNVAADPGVEAAQKTYLGHVLRHNLMRQAMGRYATIVDAKDRYTIEQRRLARQYHQYLVKTMFFNPRAPVVPTTARAYKMVGNFLITVLMLGGIAAMIGDDSGIPFALAAFLKLMVPFGAIYLSYVIWSRLRQVKDRDANRPL